MTPADKDLQALPRKVKQDNIQKGCVIQEHKLHRCNKSGPLHQTTYLIATQSQHLSQRNRKHCNVYLDFLQLMRNLRPGTYQEEVHRYRCLFINFRSGFGRPKGCYGASRRSFKTWCVLGRAIGGTVPKKGMAQHGPGKALRNARKKSFVVLSFVKSTLAIPDLQLFLVKLTFGHKRCCYETICFKSPWTALLVSNICVPNAFIVLGIWPTTMLAKLCEASLWFIGTPSYDSKASWRLQHSSNRCLCTTCVQK